MGTLAGRIRIEEATDAGGRGGPPAGFTLSDLRDLHRNGQMTAEEFERAKGKIVAAAKAAALRQEKPKTSDGGGPALARPLARSCPGQGMRLGRGRGVGP